MSVLDHSFTGQYTHTLRVSQIDVVTVYECSVSNNKPSSAKAVATLDADGTLCYMVAMCLPHNHYISESVDSMLGVDKIC